MTSIATSALLGFFVATSTATSSLVPSWTAPTQPEPTNISYEVAMTAYNAVPEQTDGDPYTTASGAFSDPDIVAARSRDLAEELPFGTVISISVATSTPGCGYSVVSKLVGLRVIADTMNARMKNKIDLLFDTADRVKVGGKSVSAARAFGICEKMHIEVVGHVDPNHMPRSQAELVIALGNSGFAVK